MTEGRDSVASLGSVVLNCWKGRVARLVCQGGPTPGRDHPGVWLELPGGPAGRLAASHLRGPRFTTTQLDHLLSSVEQYYRARLRQCGG